MRSLISICLFVAALLLAACTTLAPEAPVSDNVAVVTLVSQAHTDSLEGRLPAAVAGIERALRIEPRNPRLWRELAQVRLAQGEAEQAESLAVRANTLAGADQRLRAANWRLIAEARTARGDAAGAQEAAERARQLER